MSRCYHLSYYHNYFINLNYTIFLSPLLETLLTLLPFDSAPQHTLLLVSQLACLFHNSLFKIITTHIIMIPLLSIKSELS